MVEHTNRTWLAVQSQVLRPKTKFRYFASVCSIFNCRFHRHHSLFFSFSCKFTILFSFHFLHPCLCSAKSFFMQRWTQNDVHFRRRHCSTVYGISNQQCLSEEWMCLRLSESLRFQIVWMVRFSYSVVVAVAVEQQNETEKWVELNAWDGWHFCIEWKCVWYWYDPKEQRECYSARLHTSHLYLFVVCNRDDFYKKIELSKHY